MNNIRYFYVLFFCLITACSPSDSLKFSKEDTLFPDSMALFGLTAPSRVEINHPFLVLQNSSSKLKDSLFHIYDLRDGSLKHAFGTIGQGANEFTLPTLIQTGLSDLIIQDKQSFHRFDIAENGIVKLNKTIEPQYSYNISEAVFINDSLFAVDAMYTGPNVNLCTIQNEIPLKQWKYRDTNIMDCFIDPNRGDVYANNKRIVFLYTYKKMIDFMDTEFNLIKRVKFNAFTEPTNIGSVPNGDNRSYIDAYLGERYLYALYLGTTFNEHFANSTYGSYLEVFELDGTPKIRYQLQGLRPIYFAVDEETFTLYGTGHAGEPEDYLLMYKLKGLE